MGRYAIITIADTAFLHCLAQNVDELHAVEGGVSLAATGARSIEGGNFQIFEQFLNRSGANIHLSTQVSFRLVDHA